MATETLIIEILADDKASNVLVKVKTAAKGVGEAAGGAGKQAMGFSEAIAALSKALMVLGPLLVATKLAIKGAEFEGMQNAFNGITEAAGMMGDEVLASMKKASGGMIATRDLMTSFNKAAQLVSPEFALQLGDALGMLGKVSAATGEDMDYMMNSLVVGIGRLSPLILDNLGISVDTAKAYEEWARSNGTLVASMSKAEKQAALTDEVMKQLKANTANLPEVGAAAQGWAQLTAVMQDAKDKIGVALLPALEAILPTVIRLVENSIPALEAFADAIVVIAPLIETVVTLVGAKLEILQGLGQAFWKILKGDFKGGGEELKETVKEVFDMIAGLFGEQGKAAIQEFIDSANDEQSALIEAGNALGQSIMDGIIEGIQSKLDEALGSIGSVSRQMILGFATGFQISSPSQIMAGFGRNLMEGLSVGITGNAGLPAQAVTNAVHTVTSSTSQDVNNYGPIHITAPSGGGLQQLYTSLRLAGGG